MLAVILKILSIIGISLLILLGILVLTVLLVLFMPIVYRLNVEKEPEALRVNARIRWLFGLVRAGYVYPEPGRVIVKILCITIFDSGKEKAAESESSPTSAKTEAENSAEQPSANPELTSEDITETAEDANIESDNTESVLNDSGMETESSKEKKKLLQKLFAKYEKIKYTIRQICDKIKHILENIAFYKNLLQDEETKKLISHACKRLGRILCNIRPRKLKADVIFGTGSPDTTGYAYGVYGMFSPKLGKDVFVTPDFTQKILEGQLYAAGHITIFSLLMNLLAVLFDKRLHLLKQRLDAHNKKTKKKT